MHSTRLDVVSHVASRREMLVREAAATLAAVVQIDAPPDATFEQRETCVLGLANELSRRVLAADLQRVANSFTDEVRVGSSIYHRHEPGIVGYHSLCGDIEVMRHTYRDVSRRNGPTCVPLDLSVGMIEGATPAFARSVAEGIADMPSRRYEALLVAAHRRPPSRSTLDRLVKAIGNEVKRDAPILASLVRATESLPEGAHAVSIGLDRTSVPMTEERPPTEPPLSRRRTREKPRVRKAPPPIDVVYRMAYVGTFSIVDRNGDALVTRKYAATAEEGPDDIVASIVADVRHARASRKLPVVVVQDGASELWGLMWDALRELGIPRKEWNLVLDRYHVTERMALVLELLVRDENRRVKLLSSWCARLDRSNRTVEQFAAWILDETRDRPRLRRQAQPHQSYLYCNAVDGYTRYHTLRLRGFPTGSGVTEGACKSLIAARCKRSGQRWQQDGLTAILTLRAILHSDRMNALWRVFVRSRQRGVECAA